MNRNPTDGPRAGACPLIPVRLIGLCDRRIHLIPLSMVRYFFAGGAVRNTIRFPGHAPEAFRRDRVYVRTRTDLYRTLVPTLGSLAPLLGPCRFARIHRSIVFNLRGITMVDSSSRRMRVGFRAGDGFVEWVPVSARFRAGLKRRLGFPARRTRLEARTAPALFAGAWRRSPAE